MFLQDRRHFGARHFLFPIQASSFGIVDDRFDLAAVTDDAFVLKQAFHITRSNASDPVEIEIMKRGSKVVALDQNGSPAQSGLKTFQTQFLEQAPIIINRKAPLGIVIAQKFWRGGTSVAAQFAVRTNCGFAHASIVL